MEEIKIQATFKRFSKSGQAVLMDCDGKIIWFPKSQIKINFIEKWIIIPAWLYKQNFETNK